MAEEEDSSELRQTGQSGGNDKAGAQTEAGTQTQNVTQTQADTGGRAGKAGGRRKAKQSIFYIYGEQKFQIILGLIGAAIGIAVGLVDVVFGKVLLFTSNTRLAHPFWFIPFLALAGLGIIYLNRLLGGNNHKGMNNVFDVGLEQSAELPWTIIPFVIVATWMTNLCGGSSGREGVAVQVGAIIAYKLGRYVHSVGEKKIFIITGMAAGFGGLLGTPIAATCFALEVIVAGEMKYQALFPALIAAISAMEVTQAFGMTKFTFPLNTPMYFTIPFILQLLLLGVIFGLVGAIFAWLIRQAKHFFKVRIPSPIVRIMGGGAVLSVLFLLLHTGRYSGMGLDLIDYSLKGGVIYSYDWILKLLLTVLTLSLGFQGGELVPLFSIGASLGAVLGNLLGLPVPLVAALGVCGGLRQRDQYAVRAGAARRRDLRLFVHAGVFHRLRGSLYL
jgi:H+/Cl- antiporter ClcA